MKKLKSQIKTKAKTGPHFDADIAVKHLAKQDPTLGKLIKKVGKFNLESRSIESPFHALAESIVYQQLNGRAAATIFERVKTLFGSPEFLCAHQVAQISEDDLRKAGLSRSKLAAVKDLADKAIAGLVPGPDELRVLTDDEIIERLTVIKGIGQWTVEMMLMFRLERMDILPVNDYGVRKGFALTFGRSELPTPKELALYGEKWRPYRTVASWYLWRSLDLKKNTSSG